MSPLITASWTRSKGKFITLFLKPNLPINLKIKKEKRKNISPIPKTANFHYQNSEITVINKITIIPYPIQITPDHSFDLTCQTKQTKSITEKIEGIIIARILTGLTFVNSEIPIIKAINKIKEIRITQID